MPGRVVLAMSGGVDSSVAAVLLKRQGYDVIGLFMRTGVHGDEQRRRRPDRKKGCCSAVDAGDARRVADRLDIPFYALDFEQDFDRIIDYFADEYLAGRTPNPCVVCNTWLKFGKLWSFGKQLDADFIATGHYARDRRRGSELHRAADPDKDQSYVLARHPPGDPAAPAVSRSASLRKDEVRDLARERGPGRRRQAGLGRNLLRAGRRSRRADPPSPAGAWTRPASSATRPATCSASTTASSGSRSASGRASASRPEPALRAGDRAGDARGDRRRSGRLAGRRAGGVAGQLADRPAGRSA